jgi:hypothetical protein
MPKLSVPINYIIFPFQGTPAQKRYKTGFSVLTTIELNLLVALAKSCEGWTLALPQKGNL